MKQVYIMVTKATLVFAIALFSVGLGALHNTHAKIIRNEVNVCEHDRAILPCGGSSNKHYRWKVRVNHGVRKKIPDVPSKYAYDNSSLIVKNVQPADTKRLFYCHTSSRVHNYRITYIYNLKIICNDVEAYVGYQLALNCSVDISDDDIDKIQWKFRHERGKTIKISPQANNGRMTMSGRKLTIHNVRMGDCGTFTCLASRKKNIHLSKGRYFYNLLVKKPPTTTAPIPTPTTTKLPTTDSHTTKKPNVKTTQLPEQTTTISKQKTTTLPPTVVDSTTTKELPTTETTQMPPSSADGTTTVMPGTKPNKSSLPPFPTWSSTSTKKHTSVSMQSTSKTMPKQPTVDSVTNKPERTFPTEHSTEPITRTNTERLQRTPSPKFRVKTTVNLNAVDSGNDNQKAEQEKTTVSSSSSGTVASVVVLVGFCTLALLFLFYKT